MTINKEDIDRIISEMAKDKNFRRELTRQSHFYFFHAFFPHYISYPTSWFHREMFTLTENESQKLVLIMAFRDSGKSTIMNLSFALWSIFGKQRKKFVLIVSQSKKQAKIHFENIKNELENNELLIEDHGSFLSDADKLATNILELKKYNAKIMTVGTKQNIRGIRYKSSRPDLIICDDLEDALSVNNNTERKNIYDWFMSEIIPLGNEKTRIIVLGNLLNEDSLIMKLKEVVEKKKIPGIFRAYPLLDDNNRIVWPEKFQNPEDVLKFKETIPDEEVWSREYLLKIPGLEIIIETRETKKDLKEKWEEKDEVDKIEKAPPNPCDYQISAPILKKTSIKMISRDSEGKIKEETCP